MAYATKASRRDIEAEITDRVIEALEGGVVPWQKPWTASGILPTSLSSGRPYRGINVWLLSLSGYASPYWVTFKQAKEFGGTVRKGEKGTLVVFWKPLEVTDRETRETKKIFMLRNYTVFNLEQTDDVKLPPRFVLEEREPVEPGEAVGEILATYADGPTVQYRTQDAAFYTPATDVITLPQLDQFSDASGYAATLFHELTHSTGHESRLDRFAKTGEPGHFGTARYAYEELVAQMGASILAAYAGVDPQIENSAAYIASWLQALAEDKALVIKAAQAAQKAVDRIRATAFEEPKEVAA